MSDYDDGPPIGRIPPHNDEAERGVLGALLIDPHRIPDVTELLHAADFFSKKHGQIFEALVGLNDRGEPVDMITVGERLLGAGSLQQIGGRAYLLQLASSVTNSAHVLHHARLVSETGTLRRLIQQANGIIEQAYSTRPDGDAVSKLVDESENAIFKISESKASGEVMTIASAIEETFKRIDSTAGRSGGLTGVPSGFYDLDDLTCGFTGGQLIILAARPAMGKTALALNIMENAAFSKLPEVDGPPVVLFFSLEMGAQSIVSRMLCAHARVDAHKLKTGNIPADDYSELARAAGELRECRMFIDDTPGLSVMAMRSRARRVKQQNKALNLIVIDYLQLMTMPKSESRQLEISAISRSLKELARELDVPVIALSQLSRAVESREDKKPQLSDLRESGSIEQDADTVMMLYRPEYYEPTDENRGVAELVLAKQRNGPTGTVSLQFRGSIMRFENRAPSVAEPIAP